MLVQSRFLELDGSRELAEHLPGMDPPPFLSADEARAAADWEWNLYGGLHQDMQNSDPDVFEPLIKSGSLNSAQRAATVVIRAALLIERGRVGEALDLTRDELSHSPSLDPVNYAMDRSAARTLLNRGRQVQEGT